MLLSQIVWEIHSFKVENSNGPNNSVPGQVPTVHTIFKIYREEIIITQTFHKYLFPLKTKFRN